MTPSTFLVSHVGARVPRGPAAGRVHSVFARAVNLLVEGELVTVLAATAGSGPTALVLAVPPPDLRGAFRAGDAALLGEGVLRTVRAEVRFRGAVVVAPIGVPARLAGAAVVQARVRHLQHRLAQVRARAPSVIVGAAAPLLAQLALAARDGRAVPADVLQRLVGWGEGLTPACDDFLAGFIAGLEAFAGAPARATLLRALRATVVALADRTTVFGAHLLRLAAQGHHAHAIDALRAALVSDADGGAVERAFTCALAAGATSGADAVSGLLAAFDACAFDLPARWAA